MKHGGVELTGIVPLTQKNVGNWKGQSRWCVSDSKRHLTKCPHKVWVDEQMWVACVCLNDGTDRSGKEIVRMKCLRCQQ